MKWLIRFISIFLLIICAKIYYDTNAIEVRHYQISHSSSAEILSGLKIAFLSDLHSRRVGARENKILEILKEESPDLIFLAGDLISFRGSYDPVMAFLKELKAPFGIYAVLGNTEYSNENGSCILCHQERSRDLRAGQGPIFLRNASVSLKLNGKTLNILGVDDPVTKKGDLKTAVKGMDLGHPSILLAHSPEIFEEAATLGIDLVFCGHTHGGQVALTRYLARIFPLDQALNFLEGFFQKGKSLMYVGKGIGTSYLPFRFMVKPEITFFTFTGDQSGSRLPGRPVISNAPPTVIFAGLDLSTLIETFNPLKPFNLSLSSTNTKGSNQGNPSNILFDFESESDLQSLRWECHKWFELSEEHVTSGRHSLRVCLPRGQYPGITFEEIQRNWSGYQFLKMDIFNPSGEDLMFHIRIDDHKSGWEYADRFDVNLTLKPGMNDLSIPTDSMKTNIHPRRLDVRNIKRWMVFIPNNSRPRELYIDHIRLE